MLHNRDTDRKTFEGEPVYFGGGGRGVEAEDLRLAPGKVLKNAARPDFAHKGPQKER